MEAFSRRATSTNGGVDHVRCLAPATRDADRFDGAKGEKKGGERAPVRRLEQKSMQGAAPRDRDAELGKKLVRAYREQGVSLELRGPAQVGRRFLRFDVRLGTGVRVERLRQRTAEVQHRLGLGAPERPASEVFGDLIEEMERRYALTRESGSDNLSDHVRATGQSLARTVCVCDEYFALIAQSREEKRSIEDAVALLGRLR